MEGCIREVMRLTGKKRITKGRFRIDVPELFSM